MPVLVASMACSVRRGLLTAALVVLPVLAGCTAPTARMNATAEQVGFDQYVFRIHVGGLAEPSTADMRARDEIEAFRMQHGFLGYEILDRHYNLVPPYYQYTVRFSRKS